MLRSVLAANWGTVFGKGPPGDIEVVKHGGWRGPGAPVTFLVFTNGRAKPTYFLKVNRDVASAVNIRRERDEYVKIYARAGPLRDSLPAVVWSGELGPYTVLVQSIVCGHQWDGVDFAAVRTRRGQREISIFLTKALDWLLDFQRQTQTRRVRVNRVFIDTYVTEPVGRLSVGHGAQLHLLTPLLKELVRLLDGCSGSEVPLVAVHGDYNYFNILFADSGVSVVDWEYCEAEGLPFADPYFLLLETAIGCSRESAATAVEAFVGRDTGSWSARLYHCAMRRLADVYAIDVRLVLCGMAISALGMMVRDYRGTSFPLRSFEALERVLRAAVADP